MMIKLMNGEPLLTLWFGNFYRPAFDDKTYIDRSMELIHKLGFNCVELDSKAWEDFDERYRGGEASQYVATQEYMMESAGRNGLDDGGILDRMDKGFLESLKTANRWF